MALEVCLSQQLLLNHIPASSPSCQNDVLNESAGLKPTGLKVDLDWAVNRGIQPVSHANWFKKWGFPDVSLLFFTG